MVRGRGSVWYGAVAAVLADLAVGSISVKQPSMCGLSGEFFCFCVLSN